MSPLLCYGHLLSSSQLWGSLCSVPLQPKWVLGKRFTFPKWKAEVPVASYSTHLFHQLFPPTFTVMLPALCYCSVLSSPMPLWWLEENRRRGDDSYKLKRDLNFLQFCIFSEPEMGKLPVRSRASSASAFPHCHPNITPILGGSKEIRC